MKTKLIFILLVIFLGFGSSSVFKIKFSNFFSANAAVIGYNYKIVNESGTANVYNASEVKDVCSNSDHVTAIQCVLNKLNGKKVWLSGNFTAKNTIYLPSNITWILEGSIKLGNNINKIVIADPPSGATNINMSGGTYDGNKANQLASAADDHVIKFSKVTNSHFSDMIVQNAVNDNFTLDTGSNNNTVDRVIGRWAGTGLSATNDGNGLDDKGDHNIWTDCIAEGNFSDSWVIKSRNSTFIRCIGRSSTEQVAFGLYADRDVTGNVFQDCKGYTNGTTAIVYNIPAKAQGKGYKLEGNSFQGEMYSNGHNGVTLTNSTTDSVIKNNTFDLLLHDNSQSGFVIKSGGSITGNSGSVIACNNPTSAMTLAGSGNSFNLYHYNGSPAPVISKGSNIVNVIDFICNPKSVSGVWAVDKICTVGGICGIPAVTPSPVPSFSPFPSTSPLPSLSPPFTTIDIPFVPPLLIDGVRNVVDTIINWLLGLASSIVILLLIIGGITYIGSSGDKERINQAKKIITYTIIGLITILVFYTVYNALIKMIWG